MHIINFYYVQKGRRTDTDMASNEEHLYIHKQQDMITQENIIDSTESMSKLPHQP